MEHLDNSVELAQRLNDGLEVFLLWHREKDILSIAMIDYKETPPSCIEFEVPADKGMEAFHHPFAYIPKDRS